MDSLFKAFTVFENEDGSFKSEIISKSIDDLPPGDVLVRVDFSSLNYKDALSATGNKGVTKKYPHTPTEKPTNTMKQTIGKIPEWVKDIANWWSIGNISDEKFTESMEYMIKNKIVIIPENKKFENTSELKMISFVRNNFSQWSQNEIPNNEFYKKTSYLVLS